MNCNIMANSSHEARTGLARTRRARILVTASVAARECLSRMLPLLPRSFSMVSACAQGTTAFTIPPFQMSHPTTWMPSGEKGGANETDGFVPAGGNGRGLRPGVTNPNGQATERELTHNDRQIVRSASIVLGVIHEPGCMYPSSMKRNVKRFANSADR